VVQRQRGTFTRNLLPTSVEPQRDMPSVASSCTNPSVVAVEFPRCPIGGYRNLPLRFHAGRLPATEGVSRNRTPVRPVNGR
jgi:hypothetical protein